MPFNRPAYFNIDYVQFQPEHSYPVGEPEWSDGLKGQQRYKKSPYLT